MQAASQAATAENQADALNELSKEVLAARDAANSQADKIRCAKLVPQGATESMMTWDRPRMESH